MTALLLIGWLAVIVVSYRLAVFILGRQNLL